MTVNVKNNLMRQVRGQSLHDHWFPMSTNHSLSLPPSFPKVAFLVDESGISIWGVRPASVWECLLLSLTEPLSYACHVRGASAALGCPLSGPGQRVLTMKTLVSKFTSASLKPSYSNFLSIDFPICI